MADEYEGIPGILRDAQTCNSVFPMFVTPAIMEVGRWASREYGLSKTEGHEGRGTFHNGYLCPLRRRVDAQSTAQEPNTQRETIADAVDEGGDGTRAAGAISGNENRESAVGEQLDVA